MQAQIDEIKAARGTHATVPATAVIAVAQGEGFGRVLRSLGVNHVIVGGQTMNPSTGDYLEAVDTIGSKSAILLPNNKNIIAAASQAGDQASTVVSVVSTASVVQGIAAMLSFNPDGDLQTNLEQMKSSASSVVTIEVTRAVRNSLMDGQKVAEGQYIALVDGTLGGVADSASAAVREACLREPTNTWRALHHLLRRRIWAERRRGGSTCRSGKRCPEPGNRDHTRRTGPLFFHHFSRITGDYHDSPDRHRQYRRSPTGHHFRSEYRGGAA